MFICLRGFGVRGIVDGVLVKMFVVVNNRMFDLRGFVFVFFKFFWV